MALRFLALHVTQLEQSIEAGGLEPELEEVQAEDRQQSTPYEPRGDDDDELIVHTEADAAFSEELILNAGLNRAAAPFAPATAAQDTSQLDGVTGTQAAYRTMLFMVNCVQTDQEAKAETWH